jgi:hypothetical protein
MSTRPPLPGDDLYARLGVPHDASPEAIDVAWRGLLRKHHPDIAGPDGLELAKRINVAHDWLSNAALRERYDRERGSGPRRLGWSARGGPWSAGAPAWGAADSSPRPEARPAPRPSTPEERVEETVGRIGSLTRDELDRLALAERAPIALVATMRRFATPALRRVLDDAERAAVAALPAASRRRPAVRDAVVGRLAEIVLGDALDELLGDSGGARARERLSRGWDAAVGQARYGPATAAVTALLARFRRLDPDGVRALGLTARGGLGDPPWPGGTSPDEDEALRVSSELAGDDAAAALPPTSPINARRAAARAAHLLVLRHAVSQATFDRLAAPWLGTLIPRTGPPRPRVRARP